MSKFAIYQVLTRSYGNSVRHPIPNGDISQGGCGKFNDFTPKALKSIKNFGITHIWYTGIIRHASTTRYANIPKNNISIVKGKAGSPYAITDYYDVHPDLADNIENRMFEFEKLVERTHNEGLNVIIDFIPNHLSREYKSLKKPSNIDDFGAKDNPLLAFNPQNNYYYITNDNLHLPFSSDFIESPAKASGNDIFHSYPKQNDWYETIKLNYGLDYLQNKTKHFHPTPKTWLLMREVLAYWAKKGIDGFRCDMAEMVPVEFWAWVIPFIKKINPKILFIAEIYNPEAYLPYLDTGGFDYLYDKVGLYDCLREVIIGNKSAEEISYIWQGLKGLDNKMLRFLENHDEQRIASSFFAEEPKKAVPAFFLVAAMHQNPLLIYFGQEFGESASGESGFSGDDGRTSLFDYCPVPSIQNWVLNSKFDEARLAKETYMLYMDYKKIIHFSLNNKAIQEGKFYDLMWANKSNSFFDSHSIFAFIRTGLNQNILCICNFSKNSQRLNIKIPEHAFDFCNILNSNLLNLNFEEYFTSNRINANGVDIINNGITVEIDAFAYAAYQF